VTTFTEADLRSALQFVRDCEAAPTLSAFREQVIGVGAVVPGMLIGYNEVDLRAGTVEALLSDPSVAPPDSEERFPSLAHQHPVIAYHERSGDWSAHAISDFLSVSEFHALELYQDFYASMGIEDQLALLLPPSDRIIGVAINREERSFRDRDRALLNAVRPNVAHAYETALSRTRASQLLAALGGAADDAGRAVVTLTRDRRIDAFTGRALVWLNAAFPPEGVVGGRLPPQVNEWLVGAEGSSRSPALGDAGTRLSAGHDGETLTVVFVPPAVPGEQDLLVLEHALDPFAEHRLTALGLSSREGDVMRLVAAGSTNARIAEKLWLSPRTVQKHLERIYRKLGVNTRAGALGAVLSTIGELGPPL
jgi:DNA-binding CsgD family transcriptional regulator